MSSKRRHEGYLMVDQRESPGVPFNPAMVGKPDAMPVGSGQTLESATITCSHCQVVVVLNPLRTRPRGYCQKCDRYVCDHPVCNTDCRPFEAVIEQAQERALRTLALGQITVP
jgi:hypothetical protein